MVNDSATLCAVIATSGHAVEARVSGERKSVYPAMADRLACLRGQIERGVYEVDLPALAAAMLGFGIRQISDNGSPSKI